MQNALKQTSPLKQTSHPAVRTSVERCLPRDFPLFRCFIAILLEVISKIAMNFTISREVTTSDFSGNRTLKTLIILCVKFLNLLKTSKNFGGNVSARPLSFSIMQPCRNSVEFLRPVTLMRLLLFLLACCQIYISLICFYLCYWIILRSKMNNVTNKYVINVV